MTEEEQAALDECSAKLADLEAANRGWQYMNAPIDPKAVREVAIQRGRMMADLAHWRGRRDGLLEKIRLAAKTEVLG